MGPLLVLLWKHMIVRRQSIISTILEIVTTLMFLIIVFSLRKYFVPARSLYENIDNSSTRITEPYTVDSLIPPKIIIYYPENNLTSTFMNNVASKLHQKRSHHNPNHRLLNTYYGVTSESELSNYLSGLRLDEAVVLFEKMNELELPDQLTYTIRMKENFLTNTYKPLDDSAGPHEGFGTIYESFMRLQWAIDSTFLEMKKNMNISQKVILQEFPSAAVRQKPDNSFHPSELMYATMLLSLMVTFIGVVSRSLQERCTGILELIKMVGVSPLTIRIAYLIDTLPVGIGYTLIGSILLVNEPQAMLQYTNVILVMIIFMLHYTCVVVQGFAASYVLKSSSHSVTFALTVYMALYLPSKLLATKYNVRTILASMLVPHQALSNFWETVKEYEKDQRSISMFSVLDTYFGYTFQILLFLTLAWYLDKVRPGPYGVPLKWNFICDKSYWCPKLATQVDSRSSSEEEEEEAVAAGGERDSALFEQPPKNQDIGIKIDDVSKIYKSGKVQALHRVNLDIYKGEITVLLGQNGAGKTTLMSIITGMIHATSGDVYVKGYHSVRQKSSIRFVVGLCPQHNLFFPTLTVLEHVMFFTMLKGESREQARASSMEWIKKLNLTEKANMMCSSLSGGMQRRVQLCCALGGSGEVLVLDEPTSGLDVETRRSLWNLLLSLRGSRTVLLSTHSMEEADALGDRVALLHAGTLRCHGTPMFLKKNIGSGYRLSLHTSEWARTSSGLSAMTSAVTSRVPEARLHSPPPPPPAPLLYTLPAADAQRFPQLFAHLEENKQLLGIQSIGVGVTTLEEVFLELSKDETDSQEKSEDIDAPPPVFEKYTGRELRIRQIVALIKRQILYMKSKKYKFLIFEILLPLVIVSTICYYTNSSGSGGRSSSPPLEMSLRMYDGDARVLWGSRGTRGDLPPYLGADDAVVVQVDDILLESRRAASSKDRRSSYVVGVTLWRKEEGEGESEGGTVLYGTMVRHAAPVALSLLSNALALGEGRVLRTINHPLDVTDISLRADYEPKELSNTLLWAFSLTIVLLLSLIPSQSQQSAELSCGSRRTLAAGGAPPTLQGAVAVLYQLTVHLLLLVLPAMVLVRALDKEKTFVGFGFYAMFFMITLLGAASFIWFISLIALLLKEKVAELCTVIFVYVFGSLSAEIASQMISGITVTTSTWETCVDYIGYVLPSHAYMKGFIYMASTARYNSICESVKHQCPNISLPSFLTNFNNTDCCDSGSSYMLGYFSDHWLTPVYTLPILFFNIILYMSIVFLIELGYVNALFNIIFRQTTDEAPTPYHDERITAERQYVEKSIQLPADQINDVMLVNNLHKTFRRFITRKSFRAVRGIDFSVKKSECFGLLGVNGAGKSTTFKMLVAETTPTEGRVYANKYFLSLKNKYQYLNTMSYCPQFHGLDQYLTAGEVITLLLTLRGLKDEDIKTEYDHWIDIVGLRAHKDKPVWSYSGGCARRAGTAAALCARAPLALLDEPTSGVDPASRRRLHRALMRTPADPASLIVTSHSMDEMETLCHRILIMCGGRVCALGTLGELREAHAGGRTLQIKLRNDQANEGNLNQLKAYMSENFDCILKDTHMTKLHYHLNIDVPYSELFTRLQRMSAANPVIEDFAVSETSLEEIFLTLAAKNHSDDTSKRNGDASQV